MASPTCTILVTGATGNVGSHLVQSLVARPGVALRLCTRNRSRTPTLPFGTLMQNVDFDWERPETVAAALEGVDRAFLLQVSSPAQVEAGRHFLDRALAAGVKQVVRLSSLGVGREPGIQLGRWHQAVEEHAAAIGLPLTSLRPGSFMTNFLGRGGPDASGTIHLPLGEGASSYIDPRDIAAVAALALTTDGHEGQAYELTGPAALTVGEVAREIGAATGRAIRYQDVPPEAVRAGMLGAGVPEVMVEALLELYALMKAGATSAVAPTVERLLGRPARSFAEFARDHASAWAG